MYDQADLIGAVRLPSGAHRRTAGTEALTDILILRRREPGQEPGDDGWLLTTPRRVEGELLDKRVNRYFADHPERVLGDWTIGHGMYGADTLGVRTDDLSATSDRQCGVGGGCSDAAMPPLPFGARVLTDSSGHWPPVGHGAVEALDLAGWFAGGTGESASA